MASFQIPVCGSRPSKQSRLSCYLVAFFGLWSASIPVGLLATFKDLTGLIPHLTEDDSHAKRGCHWDRSSHCKEKGAIQFENRIVHLSTHPVASRANSP